MCPSGVRGTPVRRQDRGSEKRERKTRIRKRQKGKKARRTGYADDEFSTGDGCGHGQEDLVTRVEVVKGASEGDDGVQSLHVGIVVVVVVVCSGGSVIGRDGGSFLVLALDPFPVPF
jgi:hypothetical protein